MRKAIFFGLLSIGAACVLIGMVTGAYQIGGSGFILIAVACVLAVVMKVIKWALG